MGQRSNEYSHYAGAQRVFNIEDKIDKIENDLNRMKALLVIYKVIGEALIKAEVKYDDTDLDLEVEVMFKMKGGDGQPQNQVGPPWHG